MKVHSLKVTLEGKKDAVDVEMPEADVSIGISADGSVMVCNSEEERVYHLRKTKHGGFKLREGTLL